MQDDNQPSQLEKIVEILTRHGVEFIVVGGQAENLHGSPRLTYDTDVCYRRTGENLFRLARALAEIDPRLRDAPPDLKFRLDAEALALGCNYTFDTKFGPFDLLGFLEPLGDFDAVSRRAVRVTLGHLAIRIIDLDDLIAIKQHIQRPKDRESLLQLLAIRRVRDETERGQSG